jgi:cell division protease FtsH
MITRFGMSDRLGPLAYGRFSNGRFIQSPFVNDERNYSEHTAEQIDAEVRAFMDKAYQRARSILLKRRMEIELIAKELISKETLNRIDIDQLISQQNNNAAA